MKTAIIIANERKSKIESSIPTVLHRILDKPMIEKIVDNFTSLNFDGILSVIDYDKDEIVECLEDKSHYKQISESVADLKALNTLDRLKDVDGYTVVTQGNTPLITKATYSLLLETVVDYPMVVLTAYADDYEGYDIIIRNPARTLRSIVKYEDASLDQKAIREVNMNVYAFNNRLLFKYLKQLEENNEDYDFNNLVDEFKADGHKVMPLKLDNPGEAIRIETRSDLVYANDWERNRVNNYWLDHGVTILSSRSTRIGSDVVIGNDTVIYPNNIITGKTLIGENNILESDNRIKDSTIGDNNHLTRSIMKRSEMKDNNTVGPWANIREDVSIGSGNRIGSYVELKKVVMQDHNAMAHNIYLGDTILGSHNNIGWGVVTANYDGHNKSKTKIGNSSFVGSSVTIIAPVTIGNKALVAAGSVLTDDVEDNAMAIARGRQVNKPNRGKMYLEREE